MQRTSKTFRYNNHGQIVEELTTVSDGVGDMSGRGYMHPNPRVEQPLVLGKWMVDQLGEMEITAWCKWHGYSWIEVLPL